MRKWCAGVFSPDTLIDMSFIRHIDEVAYVRRLHALLQSYRKEATKEKGLDWLLFCCFEPPHDKTYLVCDAKE